jgi:hypothetical protein
MITENVLPADLSKWPIEMLRIAPPPEVEKLSSMDWDTIERGPLADKIIRLSPRRIGMRVGHALMLGSA